MSSDSQHPTWPAVVVHPSQHPARVEAQLASALRAGTLPAKFHYLTPQQARRWLGVHIAHAPSGGGVAATSRAYRQLFDRLAADLAGRAVQLVSVGCGSGAKDAMLASALDAAGCEVRYVAVDAGLAMVLMACDEVTTAVPRTPVTRLVADLDALDEWLPFLDTQRRPDEVRVLCAFGVVPNTEPQSLLRRLAAALTTDDRLLLSGNLYDPMDPVSDLPAISTQYDNVETRNWLRTVFTDLDWEVEPGQFDFYVENGTSPARIGARLTLDRTLQATVAGTEVTVPGGTTLEVFFSNRFRLEALTEMVAACGLRTVERIETAPGQEAVWHLVPAGASGTSEANT